MFLLGSICCRAGSKGVVNKNIKPLCGKPLLHYTIETAYECHMLSDIIVSTDSAIIAEEAYKKGIKFIIDRPAALASDDASKWDVFIHAIALYEKSNNIKVDYIVDMDVTAPLKAAADIDGAAQTAINNPGADVIITAYEAESNPYFNMMQEDENGYAKMVASTGYPLVCRQHAPVVYSLSPSAFVIKKTALDQYSHWSQATCKLHIMPRERAADIDTEMDFKFVEFLMMNRDKNLNS